METFKLKQPADSQNPYVDMLGDINNQIVYFRKRNELLPNYIILNTTDYDRLITAARIAKLIPENNNNLSIIHKVHGSSQVHSCLKVILMWWGISVQYLQTFLCTFE